MSDDQSLLMDQFIRMINTEFVYDVSYNRFSQQLHKPQRHVNANEWRRKICQWCFRVVDHLQMDREVVSVALNLFDRFWISQWPSDTRRCDFSNDDHVYERAEFSTSCACVQCQLVLDSRSYQLAAMTSLFLAIKLHAVSENHLYLKRTPLILPNLSSKNQKSSKNGQSKRRTLHLEAFVQLSRGQFTSKDVCEMEQIILHELRWLVHPPTPMMFCSYMLAAFMPSTMEHVLHSRNAGNIKAKRFDMVQHVIQELSRYITELAIGLEKECWGKRPSQIAFCAILSSMNLLTTSALPMSIREFFYERAMTVLPYNSAKFHEENTQLRAVLQKALWPELLFDKVVAPLTADHSHASNSSTEYISRLYHPISIAREYGFLDMDRIYRGHTNGINDSIHKDKTCAGLVRGKERSMSFRPSTPDSPVGTSITSSGDGSLIVTPTL